MTMAVTSWRTTCGKMARTKTDPAEIARRKRERIAETRAWLIQHKICISCRQRDAEPGKTLCLDCNIRAAERSRQWAQDLKEKDPELWRKKADHNNERHKERRKRLKEAGICYVCGKRPAEEGHPLCAWCLARNRKAANERYARTHRRKAWWECRSCTERALPGYKVCQKHYDKIVEMGRKGNLVSREKCRPYIGALWEGMKYDAGKAGKK